MIFTPSGTSPEPRPEYLEPTPFLDSDEAGVRAFAERVTRGETTAVGKAVKLFYAVRDSVRYDPFEINLEQRLYTASNVLKAKGAFCIPKAVLLTAAVRAVGIHAGIGLSDVENHLTTEKLKARMGGKTLFIHHGYAVMYLEGKWVKAAPAFNIELCQRFGVLPTDFDGRSHAIFQPYDAQNRRHMEYVRDHGVWSDFPFERVVADFRAFYPASTYGGDGAGERFEDGVPVD
ncbi:MAG: transglutaminase-like domain-containing protein [Burkholderiales bacterium]